MLIREKVKLKGIKSIFEVDGFIVAYVGEDSNKEYAIKKELFKDDILRDQFHLVPYPSVFING